MGRTRGTYRIMLQQFEDDWQTFRRALRYEYQSNFDELVEKAERFAGPAGQQNPAYPYRGIFFSILLAQEIENQQRAERIAELEERVEALESNLQRSADDAV